MSRALVWIFLLLGSIVSALPSLWAQENDEWVGSENCQSCHEDRHESWYRTYHRTMTQVATAETVLGEFDGKARTWWGMTIRPVKRNGQFWFDYYQSPQDRQPIASHRIVRTVGSHRYQQYLTRDEGRDGNSAAGNHYRLHMLWHIEDQRWVHMNAVFLGPDDQGFDHQVTLWNQNCIFCHNTGPEPGLQNYAELQQQAALGEPVRLEQQGDFKSNVVELGIACESCHGPGGEHVRRNQNIIARQWHRLVGDDSIVNPDDLRQKASVEVCAQCHAQRAPKPELIEEWITDGPAYRAGGDLLASVDPVWIDTLPPAGSDADMFRLRFWPDGTPRLTAYEYQGLVQSECYLQSESLTCNTCHSMHGGDPAGMMTDWQRSDATCLECHQQFADNPAQHSQHAPDTEASRCVSCHMPKMVYGVMTFHRSHRIEVPQPAQHSAQQRPNACNLCHLDQTYAWAQQQTERLWPQAQSSDLLVNNAVPAGVYELHAGDPVQRALAAWSLNAGVQSMPADDTKWDQHLLTAMLQDDYPAVRRFAARSLRRRVAVSDLDQALADALHSYDFQTSLRVSTDASYPLRQWLEALRGRASQNVTEMNDVAAGKSSDAAKIRLLRKLGRDRSENIHIGE